MKQQSKQSKIQRKNHQGKENGRPLIKEEQQHPTTSIKKNTHAQLEHLPSIQNMLELSEDTRAAKTIELFEKVKPFLLTFIQKKTGSRVLQLMFKWGNNQIKTTIYQCILKNWKELVKSKYSLYVIAKVSRDYDLPGVIDDVVLLQGSRQGAQTVQFYIEKNPQSQGVHKIKAKIVALSTKSLENDLKSQQVLHNLSLKSIQKQYHRFLLSKMILRYSIHSMFAQEKEKVLQYLVTNIAEIVGDEQGVRLFIELMNNCSSKQKKSLVKLYKGNIKEIVNNNNVSYVSVLKLLTEIDDTVLVNKSLLDEIIELLPSIHTCKKAFSLIFSLFSPRTHNYNILGKYEHQVTYTECKKSEETRKQEIREQLYDPVIQFFKDEQQLDLLLRNHMNNKLILGIYKSMSDDGFKRYKEFVSFVAEYFLKKTKESLKNKTNFEECITSDSSANKVIKNILLLNQDFIEKYCNEFSELARKHLQQFLSTKASFVLLALIEKGGRDNLIKQLKLSKIKLDQVVAGQHYLKLIQ